MHRKASTSSAKLDAENLVRTTKQHRARTQPKKTKSAAVAWYSGNVYERFTFWNRAFGPYAFGYWLMIRGGRKRAARG